MKIETRRPRPAALAAAATLVALACPALACAHATAGRCPSAAEQEAGFRAFAEELLIRKNPRAAYEGLAEAGLVQHNPPFGADRASTIAQWETMTSLPASRFEIVSIRMEGDSGVLTFHGKLDPAQPGAQVIQRDRFACGRIVEEWGEMRIDGQ